MTGSEINYKPLEDDNPSRTDAMETLTLGQAPQTYLSNSDYRSAISASLSVNDSHPLAPSKQGSPIQLLQEPLEIDEDPFEDNYPDHLIVEPSYASEEVFVSCSGEASSNGSASFVHNNSTLSRSPTTLRTEILSISVARPEKAQEASGTLVTAGSSFVTYLILTRTNMPEYCNTDFSVRRRFRDIVTLADRLAESYRGYFIPSRPEKSVVESQIMQKQEFVEQRRVAIEKYLRRLAAHPVIRKSEELRLFLQSEGKFPLSPSLDMASRMLDGAAKLPQQLFGDGTMSIAPQEVSQPAKSGRDLVRMFKELKHSVTIDWGGAKPLIVEEDKEFIEKKESVKNYERHLLNASQKAEALVKAQEEMSEVMGELGLAFIKLGKFESEQAISNVQRSHASNVKAFATASVKASRFSREANIQGVKQLDRFHEYLGLIQAAHSAFSDRSNALLTVQTLMSDIALMNTRVEKLTVASSKVFGGDKSRNWKIEELKETVKTTEKARDSAQTEYNKIKEHNRAELERFAFERHRDFFAMLKGFARTQVEYAEKKADLWTKLAEESSELAVHRHRAAN
ncbi:hypothetical protein O6H91_08G110100 [Diphasiastrum complanatum]|uniref:Uncharacterized protein n=1 Tax=Diphasiastrum complanatum TaxID=34168 RepID=A0ACC2D116_DIPCM|nr:hypothetical protein O6H91_08G110100 [Diphasiastrum complanatum]